MLKKRMYFVIIGAHNLSNLANEHIERISVHDIYIHPLYDYTTKVYDVAVLKTDTPIEFGSAIQPICLTNHTEINAKSTINIAGWGQTALSARISNNPVQQKAEVMVNCDCACEKMDSTFDGNTMFCAVPDSKSFCGTDVGAPAFFNNGTVEIQIGIISHQNGCGIKGHPGFYTKIGYLKPWIWSVSNNSLIC